MKALARWVALLLLAALGLQLFFIGRIAAMAWVAPQSTPFQRAEAWARWRSPGGLRWRQQWVPYTQISDHLKRAVLASELETAPRMVSLIDASASMNLLTVEPVPTPTSSPGTTYCSAAWPTRVLSSSWESVVGAVMGENRE